MLYASILSRINTTLESIKTMNKDDAKKARVSSFEAIKADIIAGANDNDLCKCAFIHYAVKCANNNQKTLAKLAGDFGYTSKSTISDIVKAYDFIKVNDLESFFATDDNAGLFSYSKLAFIARHNKWTSEAGKDELIKLLKKSFKDLKGTKEAGKGTAGKGGSTTGASEAGKGEASPVGVVAKGTDKITLEINGGHYAFTLKELAGLLSQLITDSTVIDAFKVEA